jgi:hypothetical protein
MNIIVLRGESKICAGSFANSEYAHTIEGQTCFLLCELFEKPLVFSED